MHPTQKFISVTKTILDGAISELVKNKHKSFIDVFGSYHDFMQPYYNAAWSAIYYGIHKEFHNGKSIMELDVGKWEDAKGRTSEDFVWVINDAIANINKLSCLVFDRNMMLSINTGKVALCDMNKYVMYNC